MNAFFSYVLEYAVAFAMTLAFIVIIPVMLFGGFLLMGYGANIDNGFVAWTGIIGQIVMWVGGMWYLTRDTY